MVKTLRGILMANSDGAVISTSRVRFTVCFGNGSDRCSHGYHERHPNCVSDYNRSRV